MTIAFSKAPLAKILKLSETTDFGKVTSNCKFYMTFKNNPFPKVPRSVIRNLREKSNDKSATAQLLHSVNFCFPLITQTISEIAASEQSNSVNSHYCSVFLLYSFVSWYGSFTKTGRTYPAHIVFNSLMTIKEESLKVLTLSAIYTGLSTVFQITSIPLFEGYFDTLTKFFEMYGDVLPAESGRLFVMVLDHFKEKTGDKVDRIWGLISDVADKHPNVFDPETVTTLLDVVMPYVKNKQKELFRPFGSLFKLVPQNEEKYETFLRELSGLMIHWIEDEFDDIPMPPVTEHVVVLSEDIDVAGEFDFSEVTFVSGFSAKPKAEVNAGATACVFKDYEPILLNFHEELRLVAMAIFYQALNQATGARSPKLIPIMSFVFYAMEMYKHPSGPTVISSSGAFNPGMTVFGDVSLEMGTVRNQALRILAGNQEQFAQFLGSICVYPLLFAETMYRLAASAVSVGAETIVPLLSYYRSLDLNATEHREEIEIARSSIFTLIESRRTALFQDISFLSNSYMIGLFEKGLRQYILDQIFDSAVSVEETRIPMKSLACFLEKTIKETSQSVPFEDLLFLIISKVLERRDNGEYLGPVFEVILGYVTENLMSKDFFDLFVKCLSVASPHFHLSQADASMLMRSKNFAACESKEELYKQMCSLISYDGKNCENPNVISALFSLNDDIMAVTSYVMDLLRSEANAHVMHLSGVDVFFIEKFREERQKWDFNELRLLLDIIEKIASSASSPAVASMFVSLLASNNEGKLYDDERAVLECIDNLISLEFSKQSYFRNIGLCGYKSSKVVLEDCIRINGWIFFVEMDRQRHEFFKISYENGSIVTELDGLEWNITFQSDGEEITKRIKANLFKNQWNFVAVTIDKDSFAFSVNLSDIRTVPLQRQLPNDIEISIGRVLPGNSEEGNTVGYYSVSTGRLDASVEKIYQDGPAMFCDERCVISTLETKNLGQNRENSRNMVNCLLRQWGFDLLMPVFSLFDVPCVSGGKCDIADISFDILEKSLVFNCDLQENFVHTNKINILSYLIYSSKSIITYQTYLKLFNLFRCVVNKELKKQLVDIILMNVEIWIRADKADNLLITQHWAAHLFDCAKQIVFTVRPFSRVLCEMNIYYTYEKSNIDVQECRNAITGLLVKMAQLSFTKDDLQEVINQCLKTRDSKAVDDLLILLRFLATNPCIQFSSSMFDVSSAIQLTRLVENGVASNCISLLQTLMEFFKQNIISSDILPQLIQIILLRMKSFTSANDIFFRSTVNEIALSSPYIASICCWYAIAVDETCQSNLFDYFERVGFPDIVNSPVTMFWPMVLAIKATDSERMFRVIASRSGDNWMWMLPATEIVARVISSDVGDAQLMALRSLIGTIDKTPVNIKTFFAFAAFVILYQQNQSMNSGLLQMMLSSPFADEIDPVCLNPRDERQIKDYTILDGLRFENQRKFAYGLRIGEDLVWKDADFVSKLLEWVGDFKLCPSVVRLLNELLSHRASSSISSGPGISKSGSMERISFVYSDSIGELKKFEEKYLSVRDKYIESFSADVVKTRSLLKEKRLSSSEGEAVLDIVCGTIANLIESSHQEWTRFWTAVSVDKAPWDCHEVVSKQYWKRSSYVCSYFCPMRIVRRSQKSSRHDSVPYIESLGDKVFRRNCLFVRPKGAVDAILVIQKQGVTIIRNRNTMKIPLASIEYIMRRSIYHIPSALEIVTNRHLNVLLDFGTGDVEEVIDKFVKVGCGVRTTIQKKPAIDFVSETGITKAWVSGRMSNFEYLMKLNIFGGRSFNNVNQYPIFPWILTDYTSDTLDLLNDSVFRDLSKPIGAIDPDNAAKAHRRYESLDQCMFTTAPLCAKAVSYYLMRIEPFSGGDVFSSVVECFKKSCTDFECGNWELCPEFFWQPEIFGNGDSVPAVLPPWAKSPIEFVYLHRKALESPYVTQHLHEWIDLMFGYKQRSPESTNVYQRELYDFPSEKKRSEQKALDAKSLVESLGRMPCLLFKEPHPQRLSTAVSAKGEILHVTVGFECVYIGIREGTLYVIDKEANINHYSFDLKTRTCSFISQITLQDTFLKATLERDPSVVKFIPTGNTFCAIAIGGPGYQRVRYVDGMSTRVETHGSVKSGSGSGSYVIIESSEHLRTNIYEDDEICVSMRQYRSVVTCCDVNHQFQVATLGTSDGAIIVTSVPSGVTSRVIDIAPLVPIDVIITDTLGFIVAHVKDTSGRHYLVCYTINGVFVRKAELSGEFLFWTKFTSPQCFDYIVYMVRRSDAVEIYECEAFYLTPVSVPFSPQGAVVSIKYLQSYDCYVIAERRGRITFFSR